MANRRIQNHNGSGGILIRNIFSLATMRAGEPPRSGISILVRGPRIVDIGREEDMTVPRETEIVDGSNHVAIPGLVNTHHHLFQTLTRALPAVQDAKLFDWLVNLYEVWRGIGSEAVYAAARVGIGELLLSGCTTTSDHHYLFPRKADSRLLDEEIRAAMELGIRFHVTRGSMTLGKSRGGLPPEELCEEDEDVLEDCLRLVDAWHDPDPYAMIRVAFAPCSPFNVTTNLMKATAHLAREYGVRMHTHLAETADEDEYCQKVYGKRPLALMEDLDWIGPDVWFAHCVRLNSEEIGTLAEAGTAVSHCPSSNMRLGSGIAPIPEMLRSGVPVGLAVDGSSSNDCSHLLNEARQALLLHRVLNGPGAMTAMDSLRMATRGGATVLGREDIGEISPGKAADIALFRVDGIEYAGALHDPVSALLFCAPGKRADTVLVNGNIVVREGRLVQGEESEIASRANRVAEELVRSARWDGERRVVGRDVR